MKMNYNLKFAILKSGKNQSDIAREAEIFESRLSKIVNGYFPPKLSEQRRIAEALGKSRSELFSVSPIDSQ